MVIYFGINPIFWQSKKQSLVSKLSTETKYCSLAHAASEMTWITALLPEIGVLIPPSPFIWFDNLNIVQLTVNHVHHFRMKYVELYSILLGGRC